MASSMVSPLALIALVCISSFSPILACASCSTPLNPPKTNTPAIKPPVTIPPVGGVLPPVGGGILPPVGGVLPPVTVPPVTKPEPSPCPCAPPTGKPAKCPINILKLGACVNLLGGAVHVRLGDPLVNTCCPVLKGLADLEAAACLCTTLKVKLLNLKIYAPIALQVLVSCGKKPPPGYTCSK